MRPVWLAVDDQFPADLHPTAGERHSGGAGGEGHAILCQRDGAGAVEAVGDLHARHAVELEKVPIQLFPPGVAERQEDAGRKVGAAVIQRRAA